METETGKQPAIKKTWDKVNSTYWWKIFLKPEHDLRNNREQPLIGYSQSEGWAEATNKFQLLKNKIVNPMLKHSYITEKTQRIEIYRTLGRTISSQKDLLIVTLFPNTASIDVANYNFFYPMKHSNIGEFELWLFKLYEDVLQGKKQEYILTPKKVDYSFNKDEKLNPNNYTRLQTYNDVLFYAQQLRSGGYESGAINNFIQHATAMLERRGIK